jgi:glycosyltransferase involved in cell wall biosynthesis
MKVILAGTIVGQGGIQSHLRWLSKALSEEGIETLILSLSSQGSSSDSFSNLHNIQNEKVRVQICNSSSNNKFRLNLDSIQKFLKVQTLINEFSPDIYLAVGTGWNLYIPPLLSLQKKRLIFHEVMSGVPNSWRDSRWCVRGWFDEIVGQSQTVANTFVKCFGWNKKFTAIPAIPEPLELTASLPKVSQKIIPLGTAKAALFSRLAPHKQAFWLVQQWDLLKDYLAELHIHGTGPEEKLIREYIEVQGIGDRVKCFGRYPEGQAYVDLLSSYDLTLLPTIGQEGAPLVLLESMACGIPFVAYGVGGIPDYSVDNSNVLVISPQERNFISGVLEMTKMLATGTICQPQLQQYYLNHYSYKVLKQAWLLYLTQSSR